MAAIGAAAPAVTAHSTTSVSWSKARTLSDSSSSPLNLGATAGIAPNGNAVVLWHAANGVESVLRTPGHGFGPARAIPDSTLSMPDLRPRLAFDAKGDALAIWSYFQPHPRFVQDGYAVDYTFGLKVASRGPNSNFGHAQILTDKLDADPSADAAFDSKGTAVVVWTDQAGMHAAARPAGARRFGHATIIGQQQADPQVNVGPSGSATAAWVAGRSVSASASHSGAAFAAAKTLRIPGLGRSKPVIAVDGRSAVTAAWSNRGRVMAATCDADGQCGQPKALSASRENATDPQVAVASDGTAVVAWTSQAGVSAALRTGHESFGRPGLLVPLTTGETATSLAVAVGPKGDAAAVWTIHTADGDHVAAALRHGPRARFATASRLTDPVAGAHPTDPQVVVGAAGQVLAVWGAMVDGKPSIQAATWGS